MARKSTIQGVGFYCFSLEQQQQGRNEGGTIPGVSSHCRERRKVPTMSHVLSSMQYICFRKTSGSNMGAPKLLLAPGAIYPRQPLSLPMHAQTEDDFSFCCGFKVMTIRTLFCWALLEKVQGR